MTDQIDLEDLIIKAEIERLKRQEAENRKAHRRAMQQATRRDQLTRVRIRPR
jgi:hypothetical protein